MADPDLTSLLASQANCADPEAYLSLSRKLSLWQWKMFAVISLNYFINGMVNLQQVSQIQRGASLRSSSVKRQIRSIFSVLQLLVESEPEIE